MEKSDPLQETLDRLILKTLALEPINGWGISQRIQQSWERLSIAVARLLPTA